eukprot:Sspe_Gene.88674::Locus_60615_Transcript_1_1_Confidence_1.000_Length_1282::g.88674::m.88674/K00993/EPT1; ethanolaminephosphotransferase
MEFLKLVPFTKHYVSDEGLDNLKRYKYSGTDLSLTSKYIMQHYWKAVVELVPLHIAPNALTLVGSFFIMSSFFFVACFPMCGDIPSWAIAYAAFSLFAYQTLDAIDGKQARRTGTSSPLGELFDHGCDALSMHLVVLNTMAALGVCDNMDQVLTYSLLVTMGFWFCAWEQFHTGTLTLGYANGPVEGILLVVSVLAITALFGRDFWRNEIYGIAYWQGLFCATYLASFFTFSGNVFNTLRLNNTRINPLVTIAPLILMTIGLLSLVYAFPEYTLGEGFRLLICAYGMAIANCCGRFVVARVCNVLDDIGVVNFLPTLGYILAPVGLAVAKVIGMELSSADVALYLQVYLVVLCLQYAHFAIGVITRICETLKINVLTMTPEQLKRAQELQRQKSH